MQKNLLLDLISIFNPFSNEIIDELVPMVNRVLEEIHPILDSLICCCNFGRSKE